MNAGAPTEVLTHETAKGGRRRDQDEKGVVAAATLRQTNAAIVSFLFVTAGIWRLAAQAEAYATERRSPTTRQVVATRTGCNQRRHWLPSCRDCWDLATWGTGRIACATERRKFKRAGPANAIGTRTARRMPALQGKTAAANERRRGFLLVVTGGIWRVGALAGLPVLLEGERGQWAAAAAASFLRWSSISWKKASSFIFCSGVMRARIFSRLCWRICSFWASAGA